LVRHCCSCSWRSVCCWEEGPAGILFGNIQLAHLIGSAALAVILFDGGMRTPTRTFRVALKSALGLATVGVVIPSGLTGLSPW
jgi:potassium/hydrogen antiporter